MWCVVLCGSVWLLVCGVDCDCDTSNFINLLKVKSAGVGLAGTRVVSNKFYQVRLGLFVGSNYFYLSQNHFNNFI